MDDLSNQNFNRHKIHTMIKRQKSLIFGVFLYIIIQKAALLQACPF